MPGFDNLIGSEGIDPALASKYFRMLFCQLEYIQSPLSNNSLV
jgi:hypothetical protein